MQSNCILSARL